MTVENQTARQMEKPTESKRAADIVLLDESIPWSILLREEKSFERESCKLMQSAVYATATPQSKLYAQKEIHLFLKQSPRSPTPKGAV